MVAYYLSFGAVSGDSTTASKEGALKVSSYGFEVIQPSTAADPSGAGAASSTFGALSVSVTNDTGMASFLNLLSTVRRTPGATLTARSEGANPADLYKLDLDGIIVTGVEDRQGGGYALKLSYQTIDITTWSQNPDGSQSDPRSFGWDTVAHAPGSAGGNGVEPIVAATTPSKYYLLVDGVDGGSTDAQHKGWFEVSDFDLPTSVPGVSPGGGGSGRPTFDPLKVSFAQDKGLTELLDKAAKGATTVGIRLEGVTGGSNPVAVYDLTLSGVIVQKVTDASGTGFSAQFDYRKIELITNKTANPDGSLSGTGAFGYDRAAGAPFTPTSLPALTPGDTPGDKVPSTGSLSYSLTVDGVSGDSTGGGLQVSSYGFEVTQSSTATGTGGGTGKATFSQLSVSVTNDTGLADFLGLLATGRHQPGATLTARTSGATPVDVYKLDLDNITVTGVEDQPGGGYKVSLAYDAIGLETKAPKANGTADTAGTFGWNVASGSSGSANGATAQPVVAATTPSKYFLLVDGVDGGSTDPGHAGWFEVTDFDLPTTAPVSTTSGGGVGKPSFGPLKVSFGQDSGLTNLLDKAAKGARTVGVRIEGMTGGSSPKAVYDLTLSDVIVQDVKDTSGTGYSVQFDYRKIELITNKTQNSDGTLSGTGAFGFDRGAGTSYTPTSLPVLTPGSAPGLGVPGSGALTYSLTVDDIAGDSTAAAAKGALLVSSYSIDVSQSGTATGSAGGGTGKATFGPLSVTLKNDTGLANFLSLLSTGRHVSGATLTARTSGAKAADVYKLDLDDVIVTGVEDQQGGGYKISLAYDAINLETKATTSTGGAVSSGTFGWNVAASNAGGANGAGPQPVVPATVPTKYFLKVDDVDGGSTDPQHVGWFEVTGFDLSTSAPTPTAGGGAGKATFGPLKISFGQDTGLTDLLQNASTGTYLPRLTLDGVTGGAAPTSVYQLVLSNAVVQDVTDASGVGFSAQFDYQTAVLVTKGQTAGGSYVQTGSFGFDRSANAAIHLDAPTPTADLGYVSRGSQIAIDAGQLLANDSDPNGDGITLQGVANATGGTVALSGSTVTFTATSSTAPATAGFDYTVTDGTLTSPAHVTLKLLTTTQGADTIVASTTAGQFSYIDGRGGDDVLTGGAGRDTLIGGTGSDRLNGRAGVDFMSGGAGADTYVVDNLGDIIQENISGADDGAIDTVLSSVSYTLGAFLERLTLTGTAEDGTGNGLDNVITGNAAANHLLGGAGNDTLIGNGGADTLAGGEGSDTYYADVLDIIHDTGLTGTDIVVASSTFSLHTGDGIENLSVKAGVTADIALTGNDLGNRISGNDGNNTLKGLEGDDTLSGGLGNDRLEGGAGRDTLIGGGGADIFVFKGDDSPATATPKYDSVTDFVGGVDKIDFEGVGAAGLPVAKFATTQIASNSYSAFLSAAQALMADGLHQAVFVAGSADGFLFWNNDADPTTPDAALRLAGLNSTAAFKNTDIM